MTKLIAKRYEYYGDELPNLAMDLQTQDLVRLHFVKCDKLPELIHNTFLRRAKDLSLLNHKGLTRLLQADYDNHNHCYFLVYENAQGKTLSFVLKQAKLPLKMVVEAAIEVAEALTYLHTQNFFMGYLQPDDIVLGLNGELPLRITDPALESFEILVGAEEGTERDLLKEDIKQLAVLILSLISGKSELSKQTMDEIVSKSIPSLQTFFYRVFSSGPEQYQSINEAKRDLLRVLADLQSETEYFLTPTSKAAKSLAEMGFIVKPEIYLAVDFLNQELSAEKHGRIRDRGTQTASTSDLCYITGTRLRLVCVPSNEAPGKCLAITAVDALSGTGLVAEREVGFPITATLTVTHTGKLPSSASIAELMNALMEHRLRSNTVKSQQIARKGSVETWEKVLRLQKRIIDGFQLVYTNWELTDGDSAIWVTLQDEIDSVSLTHEEGLMMSPVNSRDPRVFVGYFEELEGNRFKISLSSKVDPDDIAKQGKISLDNVQAKSILKRQEDALRRLKYSESTNPDLLHLLTHPEELVYDQNYQKDFWDLELDEIQGLAVRKALSAKDIFLVHGPPGTGKTRTIVEIVRQVLNNNQYHDPRILISSQSNVAVNHALSTLLEMQPGLRSTTVRVGREEKAGSTVSLLIATQMQSWLDQVSQKSEGYLAKESNKIQNVQLAECLGTIDECSKLQLEIEKGKQEAEDGQSALKSILNDFTEIQSLLGRLEEMRKNSASLLQNIHERDNQLRQALQTFENGFLNWADTFLEHAHKAARLSERKLELEDKIDSILEKIKSQQANVDASIKLVHSILLREFKVDLKDLTSQRKFIDQKLASQHDMALRLGRLQRISQEWRQRINRGNEDFISIYLNRCKVVGATCIGVAAKGEISEAEFDWVIIDEAGRSTHPELIVPMVRGRKIVLVGDHQQLPPLVDRELDDMTLEEIDVKREDLETSLFQELIEPASVKVQLEVQYRMHKAIGNLISDCFYNGKLSHAKRVEGLNHGLTVPKPVLWVDTSNLKNHQEKRVGTSFENLAEAQIISQYLTKIEKELAARGNVKTVGVIAGYMSQKRLLRKQISQGNFPHLKLEIDTVDAYQGREMDFILYSVVRSNPERKIGFLGDERRLNVALSRAHELLVIVGDRSTAEFASTGKNGNPFYRVTQHINNHPKECCFEVAA